MWFEAYEILLASKSPRRRQLLELMGLRHRVVHQDAPEDLPLGCLPEEAALLLAKRKAESVIWQPEHDKQVVLASDTIVALGDEIFGKPADAKEAKAILRALSGRKHRVITGIALRSTQGLINLADTAWVEIAPLTEAEIDYYVQKAQPYDKAGAYAIQEWIGLAKIPRIEGNYFTIMGLPTQLVYQALAELAGV